MFGCVWFMLALSRSCCDGFWQSFFSAFSAMFLQCLGHVPAEHHGDSINKQGIPETSPSKNQNMTDRNMIKNMTRHRRNMNETVPKHA